MTVRMTTMSGQRMNQSGPSSVGEEVTSTKMPIMSLGLRTVTRRSSSTRR